MSPLPTTRRLSRSLYTQEWEVLLRVLREIRKERGLTQARLAKKLGRPQSLVAKVESGERRLDLCQFIDYMHVLETDPLEAFGRMLAQLPKSKTWKKKKTPKAEKPETAA